MHSLQLIDEEKLCIGCAEEWPNDSEFFRAENSHLCKACEKEFTYQARPLGSILTLKPAEFKSQLAQCIAARKAAQKNKQVVA